MWIDSDDDRIINLDHVIEISVAKVHTGVNESWNVMVEYPSCYKAYGVFVDIQCFNAQESAYEYFHWIRNKIKTKTHNVLTFDLYVEETK